MGHEMNKQLSVANIEYAGGKSAKGTKVKLSDGSYLAGVSFVETTVGVDQVAEVLIRLTPDFEDKELGPSPAFDGR